MPYDLQWLLEERIVYMRDYEDCTLEQMDEALQLLDSLLDSGTKPVHIIHDNREIKKYPMKIRAITPLVNRHPKVGWMAFIPNSKISGFIFSLLTRLVGQSAQQCVSIEDAIQFLQKVDTTLPDQISVPVRK